METVNGIVVSIVPSAQGLAVLGIKAMMNALPAYNNAILWSYYTFRLCRGASMFNLERKVDMRNALMH
jgi:hypothetical protein